MKTHFEELAQPYLIRIVEEDKEAIAKEINKIWAERKDHIIIDGFRKGKVPQDLAEKQMGFTTLYKTYFDKMIMDAIEDVNKENDITVMDLQQVVPEKLDRTGIVMQAIVYLKPGIKELDYSNVKATKLPVEVTDQEVDQHIETLRNQQALIAPITDRGVEFEDILVMSFTGYLNGKPFKGGQASNQSVLLKQTSFIPGFGEQVIGMKAGEIKTITVKFPENYHAADLAGKEATFDIVVHELKTKHLPQLDDDFATTNNATNMEQMKENIKLAIVQEKQKSNQAKIETEICLELVNRAKIEPIPQTMVQKRLDNLLSQEANNAGQKPDEYLSQRNIDRNMFDRAYYNLAVRDLKIQIVLDYVAVKENLTATQEEKEKYLLDEAERTGYMIDQLKKLVNDDQIMVQLRMRKAYDYLLASAIYE